MAGTGHPPAGGEYEDDDLEQLPRRQAVGSTPDPARPPEAPPLARPVPYLPPAARPSGVARSPGLPAPPNPLPPRARVPQSTGNACIWLLALAAVVVLACGLLGVGALRNGLSGLSGFVPRLPSVPLITPTVIIQAQGPSVVEEIQALSRLESARYVIERVLSGESTGRLPPFTSDKILFVAHGEVVAGIDLARLTPQDVQVTSGTVTLRLPPPEILSTQLDNSKSYVYDRQTGFFTKSDPNLESQIRQRAEQDITQAAVEDGILDHARDNAESTLRTLLRGLRYDTVVFVPVPIETPTPFGSPTAPPVQGETATVGPALDVTTTPEPSPSP